MPLDRAAKRIYDKAYRAKNRDRILAQQREHYRQVADERRAYMREYRKANPRKARNAVYRATWGITLDDYDRMLAAQNGGCAICHLVPCKSKRLATDHNHSNGQLRGLLCDTCNRGIGLLRDSPRLLDQAADYLRKHGAA